MRSAAPELQQQVAPAGGVAALGAQLQRRERAAVQARSLLVGQQAHRPVAGERRQLDAAIGRHGGHGLEPVVGELGQPGLGVLRVQALERLGAAAVGLGALPGAQALEQYLAEERMGEADPARCAGARDYSPVERLVEHLKGLGLLDGALQRGQGELLAQRRRGGQNTQRVVAQRRQAAPDRLADAGR